MNMLRLPGRLPWRLDLAMLKQAVVVFSVTIVGVMVLSHAAFELATVLRMQTDAVAATESCKHADVMKNYYFSAACYLAHDFKNGNPVAELGWRIAQPYMKVMVWGFDGVVNLCQSLLQLSYAAFAFALVAALCMLVYLVRSLLSPSVPMSPSTDIMVANALIHQMAAQRRMIEYHPPSQPQYLTLGPSDKLPPLLQRFNPFRSESGPSSPIVEEMQ